MEQNSKNKTELKAKQGRIVKLQTFDLSYFHDKDILNFEDSGTQNHLVFLSVY